MTQVTPDPRPSARVVADSKQWAKLRKQKIGKGAQCRGCGAAWQASFLELHHLAKRSQRGDDVLPNLIPLCKLCHNDFEAHAPGWREIAARIRRTLEPAEFNYVYDKKSRDWFDVHYPALDAVVLDEEEGVGRPSGVESVGDAGSPSSSSSTCPHLSLDPGERCEGCGYRRPRERKASSPETKCVNFHMPVDSFGDFEEAEWAAFEHMGLVENGKAVPHARYLAVLNGYALILQAEPGERVA